ncbi:Cytochrome b561 domain-containing protein [Sergentomyia squamirostris]
MNPNYQEQQTPISCGQIVINFVIHSLLLILTIYLTYVSFSQGTTLFSWHPALSTIGYVLFMSEAILSFAENNLMAGNRNFKWRIKIHWIMQTVGCTCVVAGFGVILVNKFVKNKSHFHTYHGIVGLLTIILTVLVACGGVWTKYSYDLRQYLRPVYAKLIHSVFGIILYIFVVTTLILGMNSDFFERYSFTSANWIGGFILILTSIYILIDPITTAVARFKTAFMRTNL